MGESQNLINRRTVAKGMAWSVPAVAIASAAPAFAVSGPTPTITFTSACKSPGNSCKVFPKGYRFNSKVCNTSPVDIWIYTITFTASGSNLTLTLREPTLPIKVPANQCIDVLWEAESNNSANQTFTLLTSSKWGHAPTYGGDVRQAEHDANPMTGSFVVTGTPPDCGCFAYPG